MRNYEAVNALVVKTLNKWSFCASNKFFGSVNEWAVRISPIESMGDSLGRCNFKDKTIEMNKEFLAYGPEKEIIDTILHECAHALAGLEVSPRGRVMGHGKLWKSWARRVGANPSAKVEHARLGDYVTAAAVARTYKETKGGKVKPKLPKWVIVVDRGDHLENVGEAGRRMKNLDRKWLKSDPTTRGNLWLVERDKWDRYSGNRAKLEIFMTR